ncbi:MAG TPA: toll/interleukin-1 receptor domain-containing protein [Ktedonobacteraceae bacterium]|nr:toll/interleukin-1 receptor domain-containing protein [Ktedonobacteraceae bacterium]
MQGIPGNIYKRLRETLLECGPFDNNSQLKAIFADATLAPWHDRIPEANNSADRVEAIIHFLIKKYHSETQRNALVLFLEVLKNRIDQHDACYEHLAKLAAELSSLFPGKAVAANPHPDNVSPAPPVARTRIFISYSDTDSKYLQELKQHLTFYIRNNQIAIWDNTNIQPGSKWQEEIELALRSTRVALLLISADYLASDFIANYELPLLLAKARKGELTLISTILKHSAFENTELAQFQPVNAPSEPLAMMPAAKRDDAWNKIAQILLKSV